MTRPILFRPLPRLALIAIGVCWVLDAGWAETAYYEIHTLSDWTVGFGSYQPQEKDAAFYREHARPSRGTPQTAPGGTWLVETDQASGLAEPRLLSLVHGGSVARANGALQAMHGRLLQW